MSEFEGEMKMDIRIFKAINRFACRYQFLDTIMILISRRIRFLFVLIFILLWFRDRFHKKITLLTGVALVVTILLNKIIKWFYFKPRPFLTFSVHLVPPVPSKKNSSFPSTHTLLAFAAATCVFFYKRFLGSVLYLFALLAGFSRIWMGQHFPSDIVGSAFLGSIVSVVVKHAKQFWNPIVEKVIYSYNRFFSKMKKNLKESIGINEEF